MNDHLSIFLRIFSTSAKQESAQLLSEIQNPCRVKDFSFRNEMSCKYLAKILSSSSPPLHNLDQEKIPVSYSGIATPFQTRTTYLYIKWASFGNLLWKKSVQILKIQVKAKSLLALLSVLLPPAYLGIIYLRQLHCYELQHI